MEQHRIDATAQPAPSVLFLPLGKAGPVSRRHQLSLLAPIFLLLGLMPTAVAAPDHRPEGRWRVWLDSPGGDLPFLLEIRSEGDQSWQATVFNGPERLEVPVVEVSSDSLHLGFPHYDSRIDAAFDPEGQRFDGRWKKRRAQDRWAILPAHGLRTSAPRFDSPAQDRFPRTSFAGRWRVDFETDDLDAVGIFEETGDGDLRGTFLTATGDYRFLAGSGERGVLQLSTFDGAHAFLFRAHADEKGRLQGDFWSSDRWHETWTAVRDSTARLPDGFSQTLWQEGRSLHELRFPDLEGKLRRLDDPAFAGRARILYVFGSWCPNCSDATDLLVELDRLYRPKGLAILGLAFEATGNLDRDTRQVRRYARRHGVNYPLLVAGLSDKDQASKALPILDRVRSYPTFLFLRADGSVRAIYSGFSGPATGAAHEDLRERFFSLVAELLSDSASE